MSRSNPNVGGGNPSTRWHEWAGGNDGGVVRYYDKTLAENVTVPLPFTFILLDETATVKGWHDSSDSGIYANEVRDTRQEVFVVKAFKGGELASGHWAAIRDRVGAFGGHFVANLYIAYRGADKALQIGSLQFKGAALKSWMDFRKASRKALYEKAVAITGFDEGKKGKVVYRTPKFALKDISEASNKEAVALDVELQDYLKAYFSRTKDQAAQVSADALQKADAAYADNDDDIADIEAAVQAQKSADRAQEPAFIDDDEIPF